MRSASSKNQFLHYLLSYVQIKRTKTGDSLHSICEREISSTSRVLLRCRYIALSLTTEKPQSPAKIRIRGRFQFRPPGPAASDFWTIKSQAQFYILKHFDNHQKLQCLRYALGLGHRFTTLAHLAQPQVLLALVNLTYTHELPGFKFIKSHFLNKR